MTTEEKDMLERATPAQLARFKEIWPEAYYEWENENEPTKSLNQFITDYPALKQVKEHIRLLAFTDDPVIIIGPTGTGKELLARALHGKRKGKFVDINCAGMPETLIESELFGHVKGAFTGAVCDKTGLLQAACDGTIFLDEIGELPLSVQAKLLRAIQEREIRPVGADLDKSARAIKLTCRFIAATHRRIKQDMIPNGEFREDLYWRLGMFTPQITGLKDRTGDIVPIVRRLIEKDTSKKNHIIKDVEGFCAHIIEHRDKLTGNVRQLQKIVRNYHVLGALPSFD